MSTNSSRKKILFTLFLQNIYVNGHTSLINHFSGPRQSLLGVIDELETQMKILNV